ncbi:MAG: D-alanyl-D-alanine carboxypeptidase family protein [Thermostichales cyanobacterium SZTDM-1c_bins_54]
MTGEPLYGHFPYPVADPQTLQRIACYGKGDWQRWEWACPEVVLAWQQMTAAARQDRIWLVVVSAWRSWETQAWLFERQTQKQGSPALAARWSAPPGYSEHHTGYALDLSEGTALADLTSDFANSPAYRWLERFAGDFAFELSYPENNPQGIAWEPWHWRFVGSPAAAAMFAQARRITHGSGH